LNAATGLTGKPMFDVRSDCDLHRITLDGTTLALYGNVSGEDGVYFGTNTGTYNELVDVVFTGFNIAVHDVVGVSVFLFNFIITNPVVAGYRALTTGNSSIDAEVGNIEICPIGFDLAKATVGNFLISAVNFIMSNAGHICIQYDGTNYLYGNISCAVNNTWNRTGTWQSGFDFTNARDANVFMVNNVGYEDKNPHAKINWIGNATTTTLTAANTWYKVGGTNTNSYACKVTIGNGRMTYQPANSKDGVFWISGALSCATNAERQFDVAISKNGGIVTLYGQMLVSTSTTNRPYNFSTNVYLSDVAKDDVFDLYIRCPGNAGQVITLSNLAWYAQFR
jgi:hypothetical protein